MKSTLAAGTTPAAAGAVAATSSTAGATVEGEGSQMSSGGPVYVLLPNTVIQHALKIKRDHKNLEAVRIRSTARVSRSVGVRVGVG